MSLQASGILVEVGPSKEVSPTLKKREIILDTGGEFPQFIKFETHNAISDLLEGVEIGKYVVIHFSLRGQRWKDTVINTLKAYKIDGLVKSSIPVNVALETGSPLPF